MCLRCYQAPDRNQLFYVKTKREKQKEALKDHTIRFRNSRKDAEKTSLDFEKDLILARVHIRVRPSAA